MRKFVNAGVASAAIVAALVLSGTAARADTLRDALVRTYRANPTMTGARARLRTIDETVGIAKAEGMPRLTGTAEVTQNYQSRLAPQFTGRLRDSGAAATGGVQVDFPLYQGGRVRNSVNAARARVDAGRADLRATEGDLFTQAVAAYMNVIRDTAVVELNANQVKVLETNLQATRDRFQVGDLTRTDVAQSEARLSGARSQLAAAQGQLTVSKEDYERVVGSPPGQLEPPPPLPQLPATAEEAVTVGLANSPSLASAAAAARAARYDVGTARAGRLPTLSAIGSGAYTNFLGTEGRNLAQDIGPDVKEAAVGLSARIPLYQGGGVGAQVRRARAFESQAIEASIEAERQVIADARGSFASWQAAQEQIRSSEAAVAANRLALEGTRAENSVGTRTILDVLNAEQELLNSEVAVVTARRDAYVAGFQLLNAMGRAETRDLGLDGGPLYDPLVNYKRANSSISDWNDGPRPTPQASRTNKDAASPVVGPVLHYDDKIQ